MRFMMTADQFLTSVVKNFKVGPNIHAPIAEHEFSGAKIAELQGRSGVGVDIRRLKKSSSFELDWNSAPNRCGLTLRTLYH